MSIEKKTKLIYSGELLFFVLVFITIAVLELTSVLHPKEWVLIVFNWVTLFGGLWMIIDFIWVYFSKKRRPKNSLLDKFLLVPLGLFLITFDIICFVRQIQKIAVMDDYWFRIYMMVGAFFYIAAIYLFQAIYHYFYPIPMMKQAILEAEEEQRLKLEEANKKETEAPVEEIKEENKEEGPKE